LRISCRFRLSVPRGGAASGEWAVVHADASLLEAILSGCGCVRAAVTPWILRVEGGGRV
jgi:hypothetical protein